MTPYMDVGPNSGRVVVVILWVFILVAVSSYLSFRFSVAMTLRKYVNALPQEFRGLPAALLWLNIVPGLPCVLNFIVFPMLAQAYRKALRARQPGGSADLNVLQFLSWIYPVLYLFAFLPFVARNRMPDKLDSIFEVFVFLALMFSDIAVLILIFRRLSRLEKHLQVGGQTDGRISA